MSSVVFNQFWKMEWSIYPGLGGQYWAEKVYYSNRLEHNVTVTVRVNPPDQVGNWSILPTYNSEGRNKLALYSRVVSSGTTEVELRDIVKEMSDSIDKFMQQEINWKHRL